jgi:hypothetical protein
VRYNAGSWLKCRSHAQTMRVASLGAKSLCGWRRVIGEPSGLSRAPQGSCCEIFKSRLHQRRCVVGACLASGGIRLWWSHAHFREVIESKSTLQSGRGRMRPQRSQRYANV